MPGCGSGFSGIWCVCYGVDRGLDWFMIGYMDGNERKQYEKLADWGERFALLVFGSLVVRQFVAEHMSILVVAIGTVATVVAYMFAYSALKKSS